MKPFRLRSMHRLLFNSRTLMAMMFSVAFLSQFDAVGQTVCQDCNSTCSSGATAAGDCSFAACDGSSTSTAADGAAALAGGSATGANAFAAGLSAFAHNTEAIAIGRKVTSNATNSVTLGYRLTVGSTATNSIVIGFGLPGTITNNISNSIMLGMNSDVSTVFIGNSGGTTGSYGNVGIGNITDDAESLLHVRDQIRVGYDSEDNGSIIFNNSTNSNTVGFQSGVSTANQLYTLPLAYGSDGDVLTYNTTGNQLSWESQNGWLLEGNDGTNTADNFVGTTDNVALVFRTNDEEEMRITAGGNVGIGTTSPSAQFHVNADETNSSAHEGIARFSVNDASGAQYLIFSNRDLTDGTFAPWIEGSVTTTASAALEFTGRIQAAANSGSMPVMVFDARHATAATALSRPLFRWRSNTATSLMQMDQNGNLGIGTTGPLDLLHVNGGACKPSTNTWTICSDENLKTDISEFTDGLDVLREINPVWFRYNGIGGLPTEPLTPGVIAQQVLNAAPYMIDSTQMVIDTSTNATMSVLTYNANALFYLLLNSVKELDERTESINNLHDEMDILNDAYIQLQNEYNQLNQSIYDCCSSSGASFKFEDEVERSEVTRDTRGSITVVPNPFSSNTNVSFELNGPFTSGQLLIIDSSGKIVYQIPVLENRSSISITSEDLAFGTYFCSLYADGKQVGSTRIVKIR